MKRFKEFINEGNAMDYLKPKSEEDMIIALEQDVNNYKSRKIFELRLPYKLLPRNKEGRCIIDGNLDLRNSNLTTLPDNLTINGDLYCQKNISNSKYLTELPKGLIVNGSLNCKFGELTKISEDLIVTGNFECNFNKLTELPDNLKIGKNFDCSRNQLTKLPKGLEVGESMYCGKQENDIILELPKDAKIGGEFNNGADYNPDDAEAEEDEEDEEDIHGDYQAHHGGPENEEESLDFGYGEGAFDNVIEMDDGYEMDEETDEITRRIL